MARRSTPLLSPPLPTLSSGQFTFQSPASATGTFDDFVLSVTLSGQVDFELNDNLHVFKEGTLLLVGPGARQHWRVTSGSHWSVIYVRFTGRLQWDPWLRQMLNNRPYRFETVEADRMAPIAQALRDTDIHRSAGRQRLSHEFALNALERAILIASSLLAGVGDKSIPSMDPRINQVIQWVLDRLDRPVHIEEMAGAAKCSRANFCRLFLQGTGETPRKYVERLKLERATEFLSTTQMPIKQIARAVGFEDVRYFSKRYRQVTGQSPNFVRKNSQSRR
jgi:AraC-like DNA-binding protein